MLLRRAAELHEWMKEEDHCSPLTLKLYQLVHRLTLRYFEESGFPNPLFSDLTPLHVIGFQRWLKKRPGKRVVGPATIGVYTSVLKTWTSSITALLQDEDHPRPDPLRDVRLPRKPKRIPAALDTDQFNLLVAACVRTSFPFRNMAIMHLFGDTGVRVSALCNLEDRNVVHLKRAEVLHENAAHGYVRAIEKGDVERILPFGGECQRALRRYQDSNERPKDSPYITLFLNRSREPLTPDAVRFMLHDLQRKAGLDAIRIFPHLLRSSFATWQSDDGVDARLIQKQLGHANFATTERYLAPNRDALARYSSPLDRRRRRGNER